MKMKCGAQVALGRHVIFTTQKIQVDHSIISATQRQYSLKNKHRICANIEKYIQKLGRNDSTLRPNSFIIREISAYTKTSQEISTMIAMKTFQSKEEKEEEEIGRTKVKEMGAMGPLTVGELAATTGGGEQNIIVTPSKIRFETIAYANMWPRNRPIQKNREIEPSLDE